MRAFSALLVTLMLQGAAGLSVRNENAVHTSSGSSFATFETFTQVLTKCQANEVDGATRTLLTEWRPESGRLSDPQFRQLLDACVVQKGFTKQMKSNGKAELAAWAQNCVSGKDCEAIMQPHLQHEMMKTHQKFLEKMGSSLVQEASEPCLLCNLATLTSWWKPKQDSNAPALADQQLEDMERLNSDEMFTDKLEHYPKPRKLLEEPRELLEDPKERKLVVESAADAAFESAEDAGPWLHPNQTCHKGKDPVRAYILEDTKENSKAHATCVLRQLQSAGVATNPCVKAEALMTTEMDACNDAKTAAEQSACLKQTEEIAANVCAPQGVDWEAMRGKDGSAKSAVQKLSEWCTFFRVVQAVSKLNKAGITLVLREDVAISPDLITKVNDRWVKKVAATKQDKLFAGLDGTNKNHVMTQATARALHWRMKHIKAEPLDHLFAKIDKQYKGMWLEGVTGQLNLAGVHAKAFKDDSNHGCSLSSPHLKAASEKDVSFPVF